MRMIRDVTFPRCVLGSTVGSLFDGDEAEGTIDNGVVVELEVDIDLLESADDMTFESDGSSGPEFFNLDNSLTLTLIASTDAAKARCSYCTTCRVDCICLRRSMLAASIVS